MAAADFNGDGNKDVVVAQNNGTQVALLLGNGDGTFRSPTYFTAGLSPTTVIVGDFNHDGKPDVAVTNNASHDVSVLLNDGLGGFAAAVNYVVGGTPFAAVAVDLDHDGNLDVVVGDIAATTTTVSVLYGRDDGTFATAVAFPSGPSPANIVTGDFDGDGAIDIAVPNTNTHTISLLRNLGGRNFAAPTTITLAQNVVRVRQVEDVTGDGAPDLAVNTNSGSGSANLMLLRNTGSFTFAAPVEILPSSFAVAYAAAADVNGDGRPDLVAIGGAGASVLVLFGNGDGTFGAPVPYVVGPQNFHQIVDLNGDGKPDIIGVSGSSNDIWVLLNQCGAVATADLTVTTSGPATATAGDVVSYVVTVTNHGPAAAAHVVISDAPSAGGMAILGASSAAGTCSSTSARATCQVSSLASGAVATMTVSVRMTGVGTRVDSASATSAAGDSNPGDNFSSVTTTVAAGPVTFTVTNTLDGGTGSLRQAIADANANAGATNRIEFNIPGLGPHKIAMTIGFGAISVPVVIDATTQPGYAGAPIVELTNAAGASGFNGLNFTAGGSTVRGLAINGMTAAGILFANGGNRAESNYIGTDVTGSIAKANTIGISMTSTSNVIASNLISGNTNGIVIGSGGNNNEIRGNLVGTNKDGTLALPNGNSGININGATGNTIGGSTAAARNVISGNSLHGVLISGATASGNQVSGNFVGTNAAGTGAIGNAGAGVELSGGASNNTIGGTSTGAGNVLSGNGFDGVRILDTGSNGNLVQGNVIGTNASGTAALPNAFRGVDIFNGAPANNIVGGATAGARNLISGNHFEGVGLFGAVGTLIQGNLIGTTAAGTAALANGSGGILILDGSNSSIGGVSAGAGNVIAFNGGSGVGVSSGTGHAIRGNSVFANAGLGVDLQNDGVSGNDVGVGDSDVGANNLQNFPLVAAARVAGGTSITVQGSLDSGPNATFALDFFANAACDASGNGEGQRYLGSSNVTTNGSGNAAFSSTLSAASVAGEFITATATDPNGNTSEFSACVTVTDAGAQTFVVTSTADSGTGSLRQAMLNSNLNTGFTNQISFNIAGTAPFTIQPLSALPVMTTPVVIDATTQPNYTNKPLIEVDGTNTVTTGFTLTAGGSTVRGLVINRFASNGILLSTNGGNVVEGNYIGTDSSGALARGNAFDGVQIQSSNNRIGGTTVAQRNVISGNGGHGVSILNGATANLIEGNYVGVDRDAANAIANAFSGVLLKGSGNTIGAVGAGNIFSGNTINGINLFADDGSTVTNNQIIGNMVGLNSAGNAAIPNRSNGIGYGRNGTGSFGSTLFDRNVVSGNIGNGFVDSFGGTLTLTGNFIGTDSTGVTAIPNTANGIALGNVANAVIGGTTPAARNIVSGNGAVGISLSSGVTNAAIQGNYIGTNSQGLAALPNASGGISINANGNVVGGTSAAARNVISGNGTATVPGFGVGVFGSSAGNFIQGNYIGTNAAGTAIIANTGSGVSIGSTGTATMIGGDVPGAGNVISGNGTATLFGAGVSIFQGGGGNVILGNRIGTTADGLGALPNSFAGVNIDGSSNNIVGGTTAGARNIISGNGSFGHGGNGVQISNASTGNSVLGNYIGTDVNGTTVLGNTSSGVSTFGGSTATTIGGTAAGAGNLISGNGTATTFGAGINIGGGGSNVVLGNRIGTTASGNAAMPNANGGVNISNSTNNTIGGTSVAARNVISGNGAFGFSGYGVGVFGTSSGNTIQGNYVGLNVNGSTAVPNTGIGLQIGDGSSGTLVGGLVAGAGNVVSGNGVAPIFGSGVDLFRSNGNTVQGNLIGTNAAGTSAVPNKDMGVNINTANNNLVGGTTAAARNLISGNGSVGLDIVNAGTGNVVSGNFIGVDIAGTLPLPNAGYGVDIGSGSGNTIGGIAAGAGNVIAFNSSAGIGVGSGTGNAIRGNAIRSNSGLGIDLGKDGVTANDTGDTDTGTNGLQNFPIISSAAIASNATILVSGSLNSAPSAAFAVDIFANAACDASGNGEGSTFLGSGSVSTDASGNGSFSVTLPYPAGSGAVITSTATDAAGNTSEFSSCRTASAANQPPVANAGADSSVNVGATVQLNGSGSSDPESASLTYAWSFSSRPAGSTASITGATTVTPTFVADAPGDFVVRLVVNDGALDSTPDSVTVHANQPPIANAGPDQNVPVNSVVQLNGSGSSDPEHATLSYSWVLNTRPSGSAAALSAANVVSPTFTADRPGTYIAQLVVNDGLVNSSSDTVTITTQNQSPVANAGPNQFNVVVGSVVTLDGSGSSDPDGTTVTYLWSFVARPPGSAAALTNATTVHPTFVADVPGRYRVQLIVSDGQASSSAATVDIRTPNRAPTANAGVDQSVQIGATVHLSDGGSSDPDGDPLTYSWTIVSKPAESTAVLSGATTTSPSFPADAAGQYTVRLFVNDGAVESVPDDVIVTVIDKIRLDLVNTSLIGLSRPATLRITLPLDAAAGGVLVTVTSDNASIVSVGPPNTVTVPAGQRIGQITLNGVSESTTIVRASASGFSEGVLTVTVTQNVVTVPATLNVPFTRTAQLPISIGPNAAPPGGLSIDVVSDNPSVVEVMTPTITVAAGTFGANATVRGATVGTAVVTAGNANFSNASSTVTSSGNVNIIQTSATFTPGFTTSITVQLESAGSPVAAPAGGLPVTLTAANPACLSVPSPATIPAGLVNTTVALAYGGTASLPCTTSLTASGNSLTADSINVTVNSNPVITLFSLPTTIGAGLQASGYTARLGISNHGGRTIHLESSDPSVVRLAPDGTTAGTASLDIAVPNGNTDASYFIQGMEGASGTATITGSASGFTSASGSVTIVQPAIRVDNVPTSTTSLSADSVFWVRIGIPNPAHTTLNDFQAARFGGGGLVATITNSNATAARLTTTAGSAQTRTVPLAQNTTISPTSVAAGGIALDPLAAGTTTISATIPGFISLPPASVTIDAPTVTLLTTSTTVGAGLQNGTFTVRLGGSNHGGVTIHLASSDPNVMRLAPDGTTPGTATLDLPVANTVTDATYYVQGIATGTATISVTAPAFTAGPNSTVSVVQPAVRVDNLPTSTTALSADSVFWVRIGIPNAGNTTLTDFQNVAAGTAALTVTLTNSNGEVGQLTTSAGSDRVRTVVVPVNSSISPTSVASGGIAFDPFAAGTTTVSAAIPGFISIATPAITVTDSTVTFLQPSTTVGAGLQTGPLTVRLSGSSHGGVTIHLVSSDPSILRLAPNATTAGTTTLDLPVANNTTDASFYVQGMEGVTGTATISLTAGSITPGPDATVRVVQPAARIDNLPATTTSLSADSAFWVRIGIPNATNTTLNDLQEVRAGGSAVVVTLTNNNATVAQLKTTGGTAQTRTVTIPVGQSISPTSVAAGGVAFDPIGGGTTTVTVSSPGYIGLAAASVQVNAPALSLLSPSTTVGSGLQSGTFTVRLGATNHGGVTIHLVSSNSNVMRLAPNATTAGTASVDLFVADNTTDATYFVQGVEGATGTVTIDASAPGFGGDSASVIVVQPALRVDNLPASITSQAANQPFWVRVGIPNATNTTLNDFQEVRFGAATLTATLTNSNAAAARLVNTSSAAQTLTVAIPANTSLSPTSVATGGIALDPLAVGDTVVSASIPGFISTSGATVSVSVTATPITLFNLPATVGAGLQVGAFTVRLGGAGHSGVTVHLVSSDPNVAVLAPTSTTAGAASIDLTIAAGQTDASYYVQGVEGANAGATVTATATGFSPATGTVTVVPAAFQIVSLPTSISATAANVGFTVRVGVANASGTLIQDLMNVRAGSSLVATLTNSNAAAAQLVTSAGGAQTRTVVIQAGSSDSSGNVSTGGIAFDPLTAGQTTVTATIPGLTPTTAASVTVTVTP